MKMEEKMKMNTCCILANVDLADLVCEIIDVAQTKILPDGDVVNVPTGLWLDGLINKLHAQAGERKYVSQNNGQQDKQCQPKGQH